MTFLIADTFTDSLARLTADEQKAVKTSAFDLQMNPASPGHSFHRLDKARDKNFWSVRVNADVRLIVHRTPGSSRDSARASIASEPRERSGASGVPASERVGGTAGEKPPGSILETHPSTGAAQIVEIRETVKEVIVPIHTPAPPTPARKTLPFDRLSDDELLGYGVPAEWLNDVRAADEGNILTLADHLPAEAAEALLEIAVGGKPKAREVIVAAPAPSAGEALPLDIGLQHPDAQRRFRVMTNVEELTRALDAPWEKWTVFLHPDQRDHGRALDVTSATNGRRPHVQSFPGDRPERDYTGPARVSGSAGTRKTIVALHRAVHLARTNPDARVLLATFSKPLAVALGERLRLLVGNEPRVRERVEVYALDALGIRLHQSRLGPVTLASRDELRAILHNASADVRGHKFSLSFVVAERHEIVDAWQLDTWEAYRDVARLGRKTRLPESQRATLWAIFEKARAALAERKLKTTAMAFQALATSMKDGRPPFDFAVLDEAQDVSVTQLRFFAVLGGGRPNALFFAGDLGQRIFQTPFSWRSLGVDVRGRSRTLRVNYRTSHKEAA